MKEIIDKIINEYQNEKQETFSGHEMGTLFRNVFPEYLNRSGIVDEKKYLVKGSVGAGNWASIPWLAILDRSITESAQNGVYIVYLLSKDGKNLYLTLNQGCTEIRSTKSKMETIRILVENAKRIRSNIPSRGFSQDEVVLGENLNELGVFYQNGTIFYKKYTKNKVPDNDVLVDDLKSMLEIYQEYRDKKSLSEIDGNEQSQSKEGMNLTIESKIDKIKKYITAKGFKYRDGIIENLYLSLKSKPFVLLAGTSGTGKTRLAKLFAEAIGATSENGRYKMVPVRPDWSDSSDLLGHIDLNGNFVPGAIYDFVKSAMDNKEKPYFLCLDEMNLARVEYYFSDFLSIIETRDMDSNGNISSEVLYSNKALSESEKLYLPENLYIIGTVNMDETTFPFSRKVLDRANTIEFSYVNLNVDTFESFGETNQLDLDNEFLKSKYLLLAHCKDELDYVRTRADELQKINEILQKADAHIGYRVRDEIIFYLLNNKESKLIDENEAFDNELMQKILPRIQGSSEVIKNMLCNLFEVCFNEPSKVQTESDNTFELMYKQCEAEDCKYKHSARKIAFMVRRFEEDGFTSYWL